MKLRPTEKLIITGIFTLVILSIKDRNPDLYDRLTNVAEEPDNEPIKPTKPKLIEKPQRAICTVEQMPAKHAEVLNYGAQKRITKNKAVRLLNRIMKIISNNNKNLV